MATRRGMTRHAPAAASPAARAGLALVGLALACLALPAVADEAPAKAGPGIQLVATLGYRAGGGFESAASGDAQDLSSAAAIGLAIEVRWDDWRTLQLAYSRQASELADAAVPLDVDIEYLHFGGTVDLDAAGRWQPYFAAGLGAARFSPGPAGRDDLTRFSASMAVGARWPLSDHLRLRVELKGYVTPLDTDSRVFCQSAGDLACDIRVRGSTLLQGELSVGIAFGR